MASKRFPRRVSQAATPAAPVACEHEKSDTTLLYTFSPKVKEMTGVIHDELNDVIVAAVDKWYKEGGSDLVNDRIQ